MNSSTARLVWGLSITQTMAWASSYYLLTILAEPLARDTGTTASTIFLALSLAILISGLVGPLAGHLIDRTGGRTVLAASNLLFAAGLAVLANASEVTGIFFAWFIMGLGMGLGLYEAAFACIARFHGSGSRRMITTITLVAGLASTIGWPLTALFENWWGWRGACLAWASIHLLIALPINLTSVPRLNLATVTSRPAATTQSKPIARMAVGLVALFLCLEWFISTGVAVHLPRILEFQGLSSSTAIAVAALVGPAQVAARLIEFSIMQRLHPVIMALIAASAHPVGVGLLLGAGPAVASVFTVLHGAGNGLFTIARGTLPLALFGPDNFGYRLNLLMLPARFAQAAAPFAFGLAIDHYQDKALLLTAAAGIAAMLVTALLARGHFARAPKTAS